MLNLIVSLLILPLMATDTAKQVRFTPKDLPYAYDALAPQVSEETLRFHHDKHYVGYVNKLNELIVDTPYAEQPLEDIVVSADGAIFNNAAQMWNHEFFFDELSPKAQTRPTGALLKAIDENFGSFDQLKAQMEKAAAGLFGSGWVWLAEDKSGKLAIVSEQNAGNPLRYGMKPLMCFDVWEHAYYIDYRNRRADAVAALWDRIDWKVVSGGGGLYSAGYTGSEILYISVVRRRKFWREKIGGNGKKYYLYSFTGRLFCHESLYRNFPPPWFGGGLCGVQDVFRPDRRVVCP